MQTKKILAIILALAMLLALSGTVFADTEDADVVLTAGSLSVEAPVIANAAITLGGTTQQALFAVDNKDNPLTITDATGTGAGWNVTVQASQFSDGEETPEKLPAGSLRLNGLSVLAESGSTAIEGITVSGQKSAIDAGAAVKILSAAVDKGMGTYYVNLNDLILTVEPDQTMAEAAPGKTYSTTVTFTIATGP
jgi:hypothetical protein